MCTLKRVINLLEVKAYRTTAAALMDPWRWTLNIPASAISRIPVARAKNWLPTPESIKKKIVKNN